MNILVFGDQTSAQLLLLRKACSQKGVLLTTFLQQASVGLRAEIRNLPARQREGIPDFLTILDLVEAYYAEGLRSPPLESALVSIAQLAHYIG